VRLFGLALIAAAASASCTDREAATGARSDQAPESAASGAPLANAPDPLPELRAFEAERRAKADFARMPASDKVMGADPYAIRRLPGASAGGAVSGADQFVSIARGDDAVILLDGSLRELSRAAAPSSPTGLAVTEAGEVFVSGELSPVVTRYRIKGGAIEPAGTIELGDLRAIRDVAAGPSGGVLYLVEEHRGNLVTLTLGDPEGSSPRLSFQREDAQVCGAASRVARAGSYVIVDCILDHELIARPLDAKGTPLEAGEARIKHDGPIWSFDAIPSGDGLLIAAGGVEDHPLDRTEGSFGFIDSFVFLYRTSGKDTKGTAVRLAEVNVSSLGVITPKAIRLSEREGRVTVEVTGYGGDRRATLVWRGDLRGDPEVSTSELYPGTTSIAEGPGGSRVYSNTLLDAWILAQEGSKQTLIPVSRPPGAPSPAAPDERRRLGEALFFTSLMAPWNKTEGRLSRFTCETCHFEGYIDGRTHHTGRGDVRATTKPLLGLFNNRPHFSRALDPDLSTVAHSEFRVAGAKSGRDPWFSLSPADFPILAALGIPPSRGAIEPTELRLSLMDFLMGFTHRPNPAVVARSSFTPLERAGAEAFRDRCEGCHRAVLSADEPTSRAPFDRWEALVFSREGPIVWGSHEYKKTGALPYVHERGARVPSLRRLFKKRPYFTNGSAKTLGDLLDRIRLGGGELYHDRAPDSAALVPLDAQEKSALLAFLELL
jgi:hypothetical protein